MCIYVHREGKELSLWGYIGGGGGGGWHSRPLSPLSWDTTPTLVPDPIYSLLDFHVALLYRQGFRVSHVQTPLVGSVIM